MHRTTNTLSALSLVTAFSCGAQAQGMAPTVNGADAGDPIRLTAYEDNYAVWNQMRNNGWTTKDEQALRARISFKYSFCGQQFRRSDPKKAQSTTENQNPVDTSCPNSGIWADAELYFGYSAEFDFYAGTRPSGPVIGRVNAPGFFARFPANKLLGPDWGETDGLEIGLQHRSDGQTTEVTSERDARIAGERYAGGDRRFFDTISRGANFLLIAADKELPRPAIGESLVLRAKLRFYLGRQDSDVTWGPLANTGRRFSDYDRLQLQGWWRLGKDYLVDFAWRVGDRGFATDSWTLGFEFRGFGVPWYLRLHQGPMNTLSNYTQRQDSIGLGIRFAGF